MMKAMKPWGPDQGLSPEKVKKAPGSLYMLWKGFFYFDFPLNVHVFSGHEGRKDIEVAKRES